jgi:hypothetical protein
VTPVYVMELYTNLQTWKISVTPVDVLKLFLFTNMENPSDTGICTGVILIYKVFLVSRLVYNFSTNTGVTEVFPCV